MTSIEYGRGINIIRDRFELYITGLMKRYFYMQMIAVKIDLQNGRDPLLGWDRWDKVISDTVEPKVRIAIKAVHDHAIRYMGTEAKANDLIIVFKAGEVMRRLDKVNDTTKERLKELIDGQPVVRSIDKNDSDSINKVIALFTGFIASRSPVIGLTVATASAGQGVDMAMQDNYKDTKKRWRAFIDEDTRNAHREADGQTVLERENFIVDGEALRWPGDPYASAGNIINCRCYVEPVVE